MKRFLGAAALAVVLAIGTSGTASAQIVYGYTVPRAGGVVQGGTVFVPGGFNSFQNFYSPFTGAMSHQVYGQNFLGQAYGRSTGFNPWTGLSYNSGFYQPNFWFNPYGLYNYGYVRRWGW